MSKVILYNIKCHTDDRNHFLETVNLPVVKVEKDDTTTEPSIDREVIVLALNEVSKPNIPSNESTGQEKYLAPLELKTRNVPVVLNIPQEGEAQIDYVPRSLRKHLSKRGESNVGRMGSKDTEKLLTVMARSTLSLGTKSDDRQFGGLVRSKAENLKILGRESVREDGLDITARIEGARTWIQLLVHSKRLENTRLIWGVLDHYEELLGQTTDADTIQTINRQLEPFLADLEDELAEGDLETLVATRGEMEAAKKTIRNLEPAPILPRLFTQGRFALNAKLKKMEVPFFDEVEVSKPTAGLIEKRSR